jgi:hypothetical protein
MFSLVLPLLGRVRSLGTFLSPDQLFFHPTERKIMVFRFSAENTSLDI